MCYVSNSVVEISFSYSICMKIFNMKIIYDDNRTLSTRKN